MRAITVKQPWASAIAHGHKLIENRSQQFAYRGPLAIQAGVSWSEHGARDERVVRAFYPFLYVSERVAERVDWASHHDLFPTRAIIAVAELVDCHMARGGCCGPWGDRDYVTLAGSKVATHLVLADVRRLAEPVRASGVLGIWKVSDGHVARVTEQLAPPS